MFALANRLNALASPWLDYVFAATWQATLLAVVLLAIVQVLRRAPAPLLYGLLLVALVKFALPPGLPLPTGVFPHVATAAHHLAEPFAPSWPTEMAATSQPVPMASAPGANADSTDEVSKKEDPSPRVAAREKLSYEATSPIGPRIERTAASAPALTLAAWLFLIYLCGVIGMATLVGRQLARLVRLVGRATPMVEGELRDEFVALARQLHMRRVPQLLTSHEAGTPIAFGLLEPVVLVPDSVQVQLSPDERRTILAHELAHVQRRDLWVNALQILLTVAWWFNPILWMLNQKIRSVREQCCDDLLLSRGLTTGETYCRTLLSTAKHQKELPAAALGFAERLHPLGGRMARIMDPRVPRASRLSLAGLAVLVVLSLVFLPGLSGKTPVEPKAEAKQASVEPSPSADAVGGATLSHVDDTAESKMSIAASGHMVEFQRKEGEPFLDAVLIFAGRYGMPEPPQEDFHVYVLNEKQEVLADVPVPYATIERADLRWYRLDTPAVELPEKFAIALAFNPHQTKGIYLGKDESVSESHSFIGLPADGFSKVKGKFDWMVRVKTTAQPAPGREVKRLSDWKPPVVVDTFDGCVELKYDGGQSQGMQSYGGAGPAIGFSLPNFPDVAGKRRVWVKGLRLYASRYGVGYPAETTMLHATVFGQDGDILLQQDYPYSLFGYQPKWVDLAFKEAVVVPADGAFSVALDPEAHQYKGIYFHYMKATAPTHAKKGTLRDGFSPASDREWMIRAAVQGE